MKSAYYRLMVLLTLPLMLIPERLWASGEAASNLVVVADTRRVTGIMKYFSDLYNTNIWLFAVWAVVLTVIMERTGLDLKSRKIIEH